MPTDPANAAVNAGSQGQSTGRIVLSATLTLTLSILGSSVLPVPFAVSRTGVLLGLLTMLVVSYSNALTSILLLKASGHTGHQTYEGVAEAAGGPLLKGATRISLILLLFGTIIGDFALLADTGTRAVERLHAADTQPPAWLVGYNGRVIMTLLAICPVYPLCCLRRMRSLELAGTAGVGVIVVIASIFVWESVKSGLPAIADGELPLWGLKVTSDLPEAFSVLGFAFYIQPMMMPLLHEMPGGQRGIALTSRAVYIVVMGIAMAVYGIMGIAAAARYGMNTQGNVLVNSWLGGLPEGLLDAVMAVYLSISIPPMQMSLRYTLDCLIAGEDAPASTQRQLLETTGIVFGGLAVALIFPSASEKIFAVTGATAVCLVCYLLPVVIHLLLYVQSRQNGAGQRNVGLLDDPAARLPLLHSNALDASDAVIQKEPLHDHYPHRPGYLGLVSDIAVPVGVMSLGVVVSCAALWVSIAHLLEQQ